MIPSKQLYRILSFVYFTIFWLSTHINYAQGLCDKNNWPVDAVEGGFKIDGDFTVGCSPLLVNLIDLSGGSNIHYDFYYDNKAAVLLDWTANKDSSNAYLANNGTQVYRILQYGKKNGKDMYFCKSITVRQPPTVSYTQCNNFVTIFIPKQTISINSSIAYKLGTFNEEKFTLSQLPLNSMAKSVTYPVSLSTYFLDGTGQKVCEKNQTINQVSNNPISNSPFWANIKELEMISPTKVSLEFSGTFDPSGYDIFMHKKYSTYPSNSIKKTLPGKYEFDLPDSTNSYCFFVSRPDNCGSTEISSHLCTVPLQEIIPLPSENSLIWDFPPVNLKNSSTPLNPIFGNITVNNKIIIKEKGMPAITEMISNTSSNKTFKIDCKNDYCYQIESISEGVLSYHGFKGTSKSMQKCISRSTIKTPSISDVVVSVNEAQDNVISFLDNSNWNLNKEMFFIYKKSNNELRKLDSTVTVANFIEKTTSSVISNNCYFVGYRDQCGSYSNLSPEVCSVKLSSQNDQELAWSKSIPFGLDSISKYEMLVYNEYTNIPSKLNSLNRSTFKTLIDLTNYETEAKFKIKVVSAGGKESFSNYVTIPIEALFFIPKAFTPNEDNINNLFEIKGRFGRVNDYNLKIYDRWGNIISEIKDKTQSWDGKLNGTRLPFGSYLYDLKIGLNKGEIIRKFGKFEIL